MSKINRQQIAAYVSVRTIDYVAKMLDENVEPLEAIISNDDNLTYGNFVSVYASPDKTLNALTDNGVEELRDMLKVAHIDTKIWHTCLGDFVNEADLVTHINAQSPQ